jgi:hypothetical protein
LIDELEDVAMRKNQINEKSVAITSFSLP